MASTSISSQFYDTRLESSMTEQATKPNFWESSSGNGSEEWIDNQAQWRKVSQWLVGEWTDNRLNGWEDELLGKWKEVKRINGHDLDWMLKQRWLQRAWMLQFGVFPKSTNVNDIHYRGSLHSSSGSAPNELRKWRMPNLLRPKLNPHITDIPTCPLRAPHYGHLRTFFPKCTNWLMSI